MGGRFRTCVFHLVMVGRGLKSSLFKPSDIQTRKGQPKGKRGNEVLGSSTRRNGVYQDCQELIRLLPPPIEFRVLRVLLLCGPSLG